MVSEQVLGFSLAYKEGDKFTKIPILQGFDSRQSRRLKLSKDLYDILALIDLKFLDAER